MKEKYNIAGDNFLNYHPIIRKAISPFAFLPANAWTSFRLIGFLFLVLAYGHSITLALIVFLLCIFTDALDGMVARGDFQNSIKFFDPFFWFEKICFKHNLFKNSDWSKAGKWYDPLADKIFIISTFYWFGMIQKEFFFPSLFYAILILEFFGRFFLITFIRKIILKKKIETKSNYFGKIKFCVECLVGILLFASFFNVGVFDQIVFLLMANALLGVIFILLLGSIIGNIFVEFFMKLNLIAPDLKRNLE